MISHDEQDTPVFQLLYRLDHSFLRYDLQQAHTNTHARNRSLQKFNQISLPVWAEKIPFDSNITINPPSPILVHLILDHLELIYILILIAIIHFK